MKQPTNPIGYNISTKVQTLLQSLISLGSLAACIAIFKFGSSISPRVGLWTASVVGIASVVAQIASTHIAALYVGRILLGVSNGFYSTYSAVYIGESTPAYLRGAAIGLVVLQINLGALIGIVVDNTTQTRLSRLSYQIPLAIMFVIPVLMTIGLLFLPETPRYYISKGQDDKAAAAIRKLRGISDEAQINEDITIMKNAWLEETEMRSKTHLLDAFRGTDLRRTLLSIAAAVAQAATGIYFIAAFSVYFFVQARIGSPFMWVTVSIAIAVTGNMLSFPVVRFFDRRHLLIGASTLNAAAMLGMAIAYNVSPLGSPTAGKVLVGLSIVFTWVYGVGQGPVLWALQTEIPAQRLRAQTVGFSQGSAFLASWLSAYCSPYFINPEALNWGPKYCYIWAGSNFILAVFTFFFVPETRGRSLEQLDELFDKRLSAWKFRTYVTDLQQADTDDYAVRKDTKDEIAVSEVENRT
jgi:MFS family permease